MLKLGLTSVTFRELSADDIINYAKKCSLSAIEWGSDAHVLPGDTKTAEAVKEKTISAGICVSSYGSYFRLGKNDDINKYIASAKALGTNIIRIWSGCKASCDVTESEYAPLLEETKAVCRAAAAENIQIAFEFHNDTYTDSKASALRLMNDAACENLGMYFQYDPRISEKKNEETLKALTPYLKIVHVFYVDSDFCRYSVKDGEALWRSFIKILHESSTDTYMLFEFLKNSDLQGLKEETEIMKKLLCEVDNND